MDKFLGDVNPAFPMPGLSADASFNGMSIRVLTREQIRHAAGETIKEHGMLLVHELNKGDNFGAGNLVALLELFADRLAALGDDNPASVLDARLGLGWTRALALALKA